METPASEALEVDLHRIELRFADARLLEPRAVDALARSIEQSGQLIACIAVPEEGSNRLALVDGYRRILALRRLGRDTACVESRACDLAQALLRVLARANTEHATQLLDALASSPLSFSLPLETLQAEMSNPQCRAKSAR